MSPVHSLRLLSCALTGVLAVSTVAGLRDFLEGRVRVIGTSMAPALLPGDDLLSSRCLLRTRGIRRGDIVVLTPLGGTRQDVKRVVGLPGEQVELTEGGLWIDGWAVAEPYLNLMPHPPDHQTWRLGQDEVVVLGDHRAHSTDSRSYGPLSARSIDALVWWRSGPPDRWGRVAGVPETSKGDRLQ